MDPIIQKCKEILEKHYGDRFAGLILYGSQARGQAETGSDIDLLVWLQASFDLKQIIRPRVPFWAKHTHKTFGGYVGNFGQTPKTNSRVDIVAQNGLARFHITGKHSANVLFEHGLAKRNILPGGHVSAKLCKILL
jgi:hypothetical protein